MYIQCTCKLSRLYYTITKYYYPKTFTGIVENHQSSNKKLVKICLFPTFQKREVTSIEGYAWIYNTLNTLKVRYLNCQGGSLPHALFLLLCLLNSFGRPLWLPRMIDQYIQELLRSSSKIKLVPKFEYCYRYPESTICILYANKSSLSKINLLQFPRHFIDAHAPPSNHVLIDLMHLVSTS